MMASLFALALAAGLTAYSGAAAPDGPQYSAGKDSEYWPAVKACLAVWGDTHPFKDDSKTPVPGARHQRQGLRHR